MATNDNATLTPSPSVSEIANGSFIPASENLPEITCKAVILAIILVIVLAAANAYLGLKLGNTISASIPAAVISMGVLRLFRKSNILENNIVQTAASSGEALIAATAYILPALIILHFWQKFNYLETMLITLIGGTFGILFSVPLRRVLLAQKTLRFPEGTAIGQVLKASSNRTSSLSTLVKGSLVGGLVSFCQAGFQVISQSWNLWFKTSTNIVYGFSLGFDSALLAAGYIIGITVGLSMLVGVIIGWVIGVPLLTHIYGITQMKDASSIAIDMWQSQIRYIGVGTMLTGGIWTLCTLIKPIIQGLRSSFVSVKEIGEGGPVLIPRTERDLPLPYVMWAMLALLLPLGLLLYHFVGSPILHLSVLVEVLTITFGILFVLFAGFTFSAIGGYFAGLLGSTNSPGSSLNISALLLTSLFILVVFGFEIDFASSSHAPQTLAAAGLAIIITTIISCSIVITNETIQDLKAGEIVGATPWKQQAMLILGTVIAALVIPFILQLLFDAYGIGGVFPHPGMDPAQMLAAPQAGLAATLAQGVFAHQLPWASLTIGAVIAIVGIAFDSWLITKNKRMPVLAIGLGIYIPISTTVPVIVGAIASYVIEKALKRRYPPTNSENKDAVEKGQQRGLILACGIVAGAALMGVILAIPFAITQSTDVLKLVPNSFTPIANILGVLVMVSLLVWIAKSVWGQKNTPSIL